MMSTASLNNQSTAVKGPRLPNQGERSGALAIYVQALRKNAVLAAVFTALLLLFQPMMQFLRARNLVDLDYAFDLNLSLAFYRYALLPVSFAFILILVVRLFAYMHQNLELDLWHQLPLRRGALFGAKLAALLTLLWLPHLLNLLVFTSLRRAYTGTWSLGTYPASFLQGQLMLLACMAMLLCFYFALGNSFDGLAAFFALNFSWVFTLLMLFERLSKTWPGYMLNWDNNTYEKGLVKILAPLAALLVNQNLEKAGWVLYWIAFTLLALALSYWLYRTRPSEKAGRSSVDAILFRVISILACLCSGQILSLFFREIWDSRLADALGFIIGSLLAHVVIELIAARGTSSLLKSLRYYVLSLGLATAVLLLIMFDMFGYARYAPDSSELKTLVIDIHTGPYDPYYKLPIVLDAEADAAAVDAILQLQNRLTHQGQSPGSDIYWPESAELRKNYYNMYNNLNLYMIDRNSRVHSRTYTFDSSDYAEAVEEILRQKLTAKYLWPLAVLDDDTRFLELQLPGQNTLPAPDQKELPGFTQQILKGAELEAFLAGGRREELIRVLSEDYRALLLTEHASAAKEQAFKEMKYAKQPLYLSIEGENLAKIWEEHALDLDQAQAFGLPYNESYFQNAASNEYAQRAKEITWAISLDELDFPRTYAWLERIK